MEWHLLKSTILGWGWEWGMEVGNEFNPQNPWKKLGMEHLCNLCACEMGGGDSRAIEAHWPAS